MLHVHRVLLVVYAHYVILMFKQKLGCHVNWFKKQLHYNFSSELSYMVCMFFKFWNQGNLFNQQEACVLWNTLVLHSWKFVFDTLSLIRPHILINISPVKLTYFVFWWSKNTWYGILLKLIFKPTSQTLSLQSSGKNERVCTPYYLSSLCMFES